MISQATETVNSFPPHFTPAGGGWDGARINQIECGSLVVLTCARFVCVFRLYLRNYYEFFSENFSAYEEKVAETAETIGNIVRYIVSEIYRA